jgi:hypothetical protein
MNFANHNPAFRPQVESLLNTYFALIDEMAAELERRRVTGTVSLEDRKCTTGFLCRRWGALGSSDAQTQRALRVPSASIVRAGSSGHHSALS